VATPTAIHKLIPHLAMWRIDQLSVQGVSRLKSGRTQQQRVSPETLICQRLALVEALLQELQEFLDGDEFSGPAGVDFFHASLKLTADRLCFWRQAKNKCSLHTSLTISEGSDSSCVLSVFFWWSFDREPARIATLVPAPTAARGARLACWPGAPA
jgi:hypothetical protein